MKTNPFAFVFDRLEEAFPEQLRPLPGEAKAALRGLLEEKLLPADYVPRAEFEAQAALLAQAEARITVLEQKIAAQEKAQLPAPAPGEQPPAL